MGLRILGGVFLVSGVVFVIVGFTALAFGMRRVTRGDPKLTERLEKTFEGRESAFVPVLYWVHMVKPFVCGLPPLIGGPMLIWSGIQYLLGILTE